MTDVNKQLERAKKFLEKNRTEDAIDAYLAVLEDAPSHPEATQALGDLYARQEQPERAAVYYGMFFDLLIDPKDETKALAIYNRFLKNLSANQPPERIARYAFLQQKQNRPEEASEQYGKAAELFTLAGREEDALFCLERMAQLEPENLSRQVTLAEVAECSVRNVNMERAQTIARASRPLCQFYLSGLRLRIAEHSEPGCCQGHVGAAKEPAAVVIQFFGHGKFFLNQPAN